MCEQAEHLALQGQRAGDRVLLQRLDHQRLKQTDIRRDVRLVRLAARLEDGRDLLLRTLLHAPQPTKHTQQQYT